MLPNTNHAAVLALSVAASDFLRCPSNCLKAAAGADIFCETNNYSLETRKFCAGWTLGTIRNEENYTMATNRLDRSWYRRHCKHKLHFCANQNFNDSRLLPFGSSTQPSYCRQWYHNGLRRDWTSPCEHLSLCLVFTRCWVAPFHPLC